MGDDPYRQVTFLWTTSRHDLMAAHRDDLADHHLERMGPSGPWRERKPRSLRCCKDAHPDIVVLTEPWAKDGDSQRAHLAGPLGLPHHALSGVAAGESRAWWRIGDVVGDRLGRERAAGAGQPVAVADGPHVGALRGAEGQPPGWAAGVIGAGGDRQGDGGGCLADGLA